MMKINMEMSNIQVTKIIGRKNKDTITHKDNRDLTTGLAEFKRIEVIEQEIKNEQGKKNTREIPKEIKQK